MAATQAETGTGTRTHQLLYVQVLIGILIGIALGFYQPALAEKMKPLGDGFIKLIRMMIAPIIFCTVVSGIANIGDMKKLGRVGLKALLYFEVVTTAALLIGLLVVSVVQPGKGVNADPATLDAKAVAQYTNSAKNLSTTDFVLNIIPDTALEALSKGEILQVLLVAILFGCALATFPQGKPILDLFHYLNHILFQMIGYIMKLAPLGAFGAMAFTIGKYGIKTLISLGTVILCMYITSIFFVFVVLGLIARIHNFSVWRLVKYIKEELLIVLGTSSSESVLPRIMDKLEKLGCSRSVVGLVIPSGYSFNLDGTSIYLTIAAIFVAQATNTHLSVGQTVQLLVVLMLTSKGAAAVTGGGFITLAATISSLGTLPVAGITLLLGIDRFMSEMRGLTNLVGNTVATIVVAKWEKEFDPRKAGAIHTGPMPAELEPILASVPDDSLHM
jgi:aerobic C4-dicarboxylate transport protein